MDNLIFPIPIIHIGPVAVQLPGLVILFGFWTALWISARAVKRLRAAGETGLAEDEIYNLGLYAAVAGVLGARAWYVVMHWPAFASDPLAIAGLNLSTLDGAGGIVIGLLAGAIYARHRRLRAARLLDALAPGAALLIAAISLANLFSGDAYGTPSTLPWSIELWDTERHPAQIYEMLAALATLGVLWAVLTRHPAPGTLALLLVILYSAQRLFLERFRAESLLLPGGWRAPQVLALAVLAGSLWVLSHRVQGYGHLPPIVAAADSSPETVAGQRKAHS